jgi:hypothetical protein
MAAVVFKNHFCPTYFAAQQVDKEVPGMSAFGGLMLNKYVGGGLMSMLSTWPPR